MIYTKFRITKNSRCMKRKQFKETYFLLQILFVSSRVTRVFRYRSCDVEKCFCITSFIPFWWEGSPYIHVTKHFCSIEGSRACRPLACNRFCSLWFWFRRPVLKFECPNDLSVHTCTQATLPVVCVYVFLKPPTNIISLPNLFWQSTVYCQKYSPTHWLKNRPSSLLISEIIFPSRSFYERQNVCIYTMSDILKPVVWYR